MYLYADQIIRRIRDLDPEGVLHDGTYTVVLNYAGHNPELHGHPSAFARVEETRGYEVAYSAMLMGTDMNFVDVGDRIGVWTDDDGTVYLNRVVHIDAPAGVALDVARLYDQKAIWDWKRAEVILSTEPATAL